VSGVPVTGLTIVIVVRVLVSRCSQSLGVCGCSARSGVLQIRQHPFWALGSRGLVLLIVQDWFASSLGPVLRQARGRRGTLPA
jgi:hypothetical protein